MFTSLLSNIPWNFPIIIPWNPQLKTDGTSSLLIFFCIKEKRLHKNYYGRISPKIDGSNVNNMS